MNAHQWTGDDDREIGTVADHPAEQCYQEAAVYGQSAAYLLTRGLLPLDAVLHAMAAAGYYHDGQRAEGICPVCGGAYPCEACGG